MGLKQFLTPKLSASLRCPSCRVRIEFSGPFSWGMEFAYLLLSICIYQLVDGNYTQCLIILPFAFLFMALDFRYSRMEALGG